MHNNVQLTVLLSLHHGLDVCIGVADANSGAEPFPRFFSHWWDWMQLALSYFSTDPKWFYWYWVAADLIPSSWLVGFYHRIVNLAVLRNLREQIEQGITKDRKGSQHILSCSSSHPLRTRPRRESASVLQLCQTPESLEHRAALDNSKHTKTSMNFKAENLINWLIMINWLHFASSVSHAA
jgi:hypothetical protein